MNSLPPQHGLVAAHAGAAPALPREPGSSHEMMVAIVFRRDRVARTNKTVYICFILVLMMLATSPLRAAGADADAVVPKTLVVRVDPRTGKLVRRETVARPAVAPARISEMVDQTARAHDVDPLLVHSIIQVESNYNPNAVSPKGAEGLMQLMPPTARMLGVGNSFDPGENIEAGVKYLKQLQDLYKDDRLALAAYNAGPGAVEKFKRSVPPYPETQKYVESVGKRYGEARKASASMEKVSQEKAVEQKEAVTHTAQGPEISAPTTVEQYSKLEQFVDENGRLHLRTAPAQ
jgi:soluble lytic murein transglycosylase-like protein